MGGRRGRRRRARWWNRWLVGGGGNRYGDFRPLPDETIEVVAPNGDRLTAHPSGDANQWALVIEALVEWYSPN